MSSRVSPTDRLRAEIDALFTGERDLVEVLEDVARLGARLLIQSAVEAEVAEFLGRARYQRAAAAQARPGHRNGYCPTTIKTTTGPVTVHRPKLRDTSERFASRLFGTGVTKTNALESLVIAGFVRGLSVRDVEQTLADALGAEATLSKSTVSRVCEAIKTEFEAWRERRLGDLELDYLFLDGSCFRMHAGAGPSRCWPRGASPPGASRSWSGWRPAGARAPTPVAASWRTWVTAVCAHRCWSSATAPGGWSTRPRPCWPARCANAA